MIEKSRGTERIDWIARFTVPDGAPELAVDFLNAASKLNEVLPHDSEFDEMMGKLLEARDIALRVLSTGAVESAVRLGAGEFETQSNRVGTDDEPKNGTEDQADGSAHQENDDFDNQRG